MQGKTNTMIAKVILIGDSGVGKTSILNRQVRGVFKFDTQTTVHPEQSTVKLNIEGTEVNLRLWDTAGQEKFRSITISFYKETKGAFVIFDLTSRQSFENVRLWLRQLKNHAGEQIVKILLGNKSDLTPLAVEESEFAELAKEVGASYYMVSASKDINIKEAFNDMAKEVKKRFIGSSTETQDLMKLNSESIAQGNKKKKQDGTCC